ncbi:MAG: FesM [Chloroflexota bacterium]
MISSIEHRRLQIDVLRIPGLGHFLRWKHSRTFMQSILFVLAAAIIVDGLLGNQIASRNVASVAAWVHYRGLVVLALLLVGNLFCAACPFVLPRKLAKWLGKPTRRWPKALRNKWIAIGGLLGILFAYELFDLWATPWWTAWVAVIYFGLAFLLEALFTRSSFCKYVCPLGTFNFLYSAVSPTQIMSRNLDICRNCVGHECINGVTNRSSNPVDQKNTSLSDSSLADTSHAIKSKPATQEIVLQDGCQLELFVPTIQSNMDCTLCLDCVRACPYDNVALAVRPPGDELFRQTWRNRIDLALLAIIAAFAGLLNAFAMTPPVFSLEAWLARVLDTQSEAIVLGLTFLVGIIVGPLILVYGAAWLGRTLAQAKEPISLNQLVIRYAYSFVPVGFVIWFAHYLFHFLIGAMTIVPTFQTFFYRTLRLALFGRPDWTLAALFVPSVSTIQTIQMIFTYGGLLVGIGVVFSAASKAHKNRQRALLEALPWVMVLILLAIASGYTFLQPMEMRGSGIGA